MTVLQISIEVNSGSVGRIAEQIGEEILETGWKSYITFARNNLPSKSDTIRIGKMKDIYWHVLMTRIFDNHCFESKRSTKELIYKIKKIKPDIIHLHHLHGYYINIEILFEYLAKINIPIVWTFHDCWSFTGHCAYYEYINCQKWQTQCHSCPQTNQYPKSILIDRSRQNFTDKKKIFTSVKNMFIVPVSYWLAEEIKKSFLRKYPIKVIQNGIDVNAFMPSANTSILEKYGINDKKFIILGVASTWELRKGLDYFLKLSSKLSDNYQIILVGLNKNQINQIPCTIIGIERTEDLQELAVLYTAADVFMNPTLEDTFPTTNLEAQACGTPVITFNSGGAPETISDRTGFVVKKGSIEGIIEAIEEVRKKGKAFYSKSCRLRAESYFNRKNRFQEYIDLYKNIQQNSF